MNKIFFIADTHFSDKQIFKYENRPFDDINLMNDSIINNWNLSVDSDDLIYILGDFGSVKYLKELNGHKLLIKGNHDVLSNAEYRNLGFDEVYDYPIIIEDFWILSHAPLYVCENMPYANIFGHVHNNPIVRDFSKQHYCVSVERTEYSPVSFEKIKNTINNLIKE